MKASTRKNLLLSLSLLLCLLPIQASEEQKAGSIAVSGAVKQALMLTEKDLSEMPRAQATLNEHGNSVHYEGVLISEILKKAGAQMGEELRGKALATYVIAKGRDGYEVLYSIAELDPALTQAKVLLADRSDGKTLPDSVGPFRIVAPDDKKMARSVRMLGKLEVVRLQP